MKTIEINPSNEMHLLRHFSSVSEDYIESLIGQSFEFYDHSLYKFNIGVIDKNLAEEALKTKGSKFFSNISGITNPKELLIVIKQEFESMDTGKIDWEVSSDRKFFSFLIKYKEPVGFKNLIPLSSLSDEDQKRVRVVPRGSSGGEKSILIKTITNVEAKPVSTIEVGLTDFKELNYYFVTAYPGNLEVTPDFPHLKQNKKEYVKSKNYWDSHVFIV